MAVGVMEDPEWLSDRLRQMCSA